MSYSVDLSYLDYFKNAAAGLHDESPINDRLRVTGFALGTVLVGGLRTVSRVVKLVIEVTKVIFYALASLFTLGHYGNLDRLKDHCKLLTLNLAALIGQPLQIVIHSLACVLGIISPKIAYRTMQIGTTTLAWITSCENEIWQQYKTPKIYTKIIEPKTSQTTNALNQRPSVAQLAMKTILLEFSDILDSALVAPLGYMDQFHSFGANPKTLTSEQKTLIPILLLNGNYSQQGTFLPLLHALNLSNNKRPVYTINLPPNTIQPSFIASKIQEIKNQYGRADDDHFKMDLLGHSMGACLIQEICRSPNKTPIQIRWAVTVGMPFHAQSDTPEESFDIIGTKDFLVPRESQLDKDRQIKIKTGHLGLLFHHKSLDAMTELLA